MSSEVPTAEHHSASCILVATERGTFVTPPAEGDAEVDLGGLVRRLAERLGVQPEERVRITVERIDEARSDAQEGTP